MLGSKAPFKDQADDRSAVCGFRIHTDAKILSVRTKKGHKILIAFIDDNSRCTFTYLLRSLKEYIDVFKHFIEVVCKLAGHIVVVVRSDNGGIYIAEGTKAYCASKGIRLEFSPPHCQPANGMAEAFFRVCFALVRTALYDQQRDDSY
jgi:transposase InsO family protein